MEKENKSLMAVVVNINTDNTVSFKFGDAETKEMSLPKFMKRLKKLSLIIPDTDDEIERFLQDIAIMGLSKSSLSFDEIIENFKNKESV